MTDVSHERPSSAKRLSILSALALCMLAAGCKSPGDYHAEADTVAYDIIAAKQREALGRTESFTIEKPADTLRRRLIEAQGLSLAGGESLGTAALDQPDDWPEKKPKQDDPPPASVEAADQMPETIVLTLFDALQAAAANSREYQSRKEDVFRAALDLDLERDDFRSTFTGLMDAVFTNDMAGSETVNSVDSSHSARWSKLFESGASVTAGLALDLVKILSGNREGTLGIASDATLSIPLLRGAGKRIVTEPLTQAERSVVYAIHDFERFKRTFAVRVADDYLSVLQNLDQIRNTEENYRSLIKSARRARRLADAGRLSGIQVDQARQNELQARNRWIAARENYQANRDRFKLTLGLPVDALLEMDPRELEYLSAAARSALGDTDEVGRPRDEGSPADETAEVRAADAPVNLNEPSREDGGPYEIQEHIAVTLALDNRLDLRTAQGRLYDAQRKVIVAANALEAGLDIEASAAFGERRSASSASSPNAELRPERGVYKVGIFADLPWERTAARNTYRKSFINFERAARDLQESEDRVKLEIRDDLRNLLRARESIKIQLAAVTVANRRVDSVALFLDAGRAEIRDLLEAQEDLVSAQNALTANLVDYRVAALALQRDMGVLEVDERGLWREYDPAKFRESQ